MLEKKSMEKCREGWEKFVVLEPTIWHSIDRSILGRVPGASDKGTIQGIRSGRLLA